jgi:rod shape determining protein RodA
VLAVAGATRVAKRFFTRMSWTMTFAVVALLVIGVFFVYSACYVSEESPVRLLYKKQIVWGLAGFLCYWALAVTDYRHLRKLSWTFYAASIVLLILVLFMGTTIYGAKRWLMFLGIGVQPSEVAKFAAVFVLARKLSRPGLNLGEPRALLEVAGIALVPLCLILLEPDFGTALVFIPMTLAMMYAAGMPVRILGIIFLIGAVLLGVLMAAMFVPPALGVTREEHGDILKWIGLRTYHYDRLAVFFDADLDPLAKGWNKRQSEIAVGSGGLFGKGYLKGTQNILGFLPRSVAPTDFIFSVIAEEKGFMGSLTVLGLFSILMVSGVRTALSAPDKMGRLLCVGFLSLLFCHVFVNIAMTVGLMPITGLPLPLLSYGGSFMMVTMASLGIVQSVRIHAKQPKVAFQQRGLWGPAVGG